ncbi:MAG: hypothetical protein DHS20C14_16460 [Phycisphaeraceae bacterium]|nr:MAG: hypothetical protein DHS20C14_16460 [Phycisphaeraceae bacterium]
MSAVAMDLGLTAYSIVEIHAFEHSKNTTRPASVRASLHFEAKLGPPSGVESLGRRVFVDQAAMEVTLSIDSTTWRTWKGFLRKPSKPDWRSEPA